MAREDKGARSEPSNHTSPAVGSISFSTERPIVLLPEPYSPTRPSTSPFAISKLTSSTARTGWSPWPKYFLRPRTANIGALIGGSRLAPVTVAGMTTDPRTHSKDAPADAARALACGNFRKRRHRGGTFGQHQRAARS